MSICLTHYTSRRTSASRFRITKSRQSDKPGSQVDRYFALPLTEPGAECDPRGRLLQSGLRSSRRGPVELTNRPPIRNEEQLLRPLHRCQQPFYTHRYPHAAHRELQPLYERGSQRNPYLQPEFLITGRFGLQRLDYGNAVGGDHTIASRAGTLEGFPAYHGQDVIPPLFDLRLRRPEPGACLLWPAVHPLVDRRRTQNCTAATASISAVASCALLSRPTTRPVRRSSSRRPKPRTSCRAPGLRSLPLCSVCPIPRAA